MSSISHNGSSSSGSSDQHTTQYVYKSGDWICPRCNFNVFASKSVCKCGQARPGTSTTNPDHGQARPGTLLQEPVASSSTQNSDTITCVICMVNQRNVVIRTCGHIVLCKECVSKISPKKCPICRITFSDNDIINGIIS